MPTRKSTLTELNQMVSLSRQLIARECLATHPKRRFRCQLEAGHLFDTATLEPQAEPHQWQRRRGTIHKWIT